MQIAAARENDNDNGSVAAADGGGTRGARRCLRKIGTFVIYPVDPGFCRIVDIRSSSLQVSYG